ncbi:hypothetical protein EZS27_007633 [termite gut metagenome]|uniref:DUF4422 domain-containing protein n=1 Tax=termite gut metagenome TaxID=433724 RepID=A0A5J4SHQ2_9ZZZZ
MSNVKILVCAHKQDYVKSDDIYMPIQAGKAISNVDLGFQGDDTGDNISEKNPYYCELTVQYWAWKNLKDVDYIGLCHYRRYFDLSSMKVNTISDFDLIFNRYDIILVKLRYFPHSSLFHLTELTTKEDVFILCNIIKNYFPQYEKVMIDYLCNNNKLISFNMFIAPKKYFIEYSEWLFSVLSIVENNIKFSEYSRLKRVLGYMGEVLLPIYCITNKLRIKHCNILSNPNIREKKSLMKNIINRYRFGICFKLISPFKLKDIMIYDATIVGLEKDGIIPIIKEKRER